MRAIPRVVPDSSPFSEKHSGPRHSSPASPARAQMSCLLRRRRHLRRILVPELGPGCFPEWTAVAVRFQSWETLLFQALPYPHSSASKRPGSPRRSRPHSNVSSTVSPTDETARSFDHSHAQQYEAGFSMSPDPPHLRVHGDSLHGWAYGRFKGPRHRSDGCWGRSSAWYLPRAHWFMVSRALC